MTLPPSPEQEMHTLEEGMVECGKLLRQFRREGDDVAADLTEADLNVMIERHAELVAENHARLAAK